MSDAVSELEVALWGCNEVRDWAIFYGFIEEVVLSNIFNYKLCGRHLLTDIITCDELGITIPLATRMFEIRILELKERHCLEKSRNSRSNIVKINVKNEPIKSSKGIFGIEDGANILPSSENMFPILLGVKRHIPDFRNESEEEDGSFEEEDEYEVENNSDIEIIGIYQHENV
jgi:hypothetical protein